MNANIQRILVTGDSLYGGCMALLDVQPSSAGLDCPGSWVTFSCSGDFSSRQEAQRVFDAAQLGYALNKRLRIQISDSQTHNGFCWARRVEVLPN